MTTEKPDSLALLTRAEVDWLQGSIKVSKSFEYKMRSNIRKKLEVLTDYEIPLLIEKGFTAGRDLNPGTTQSDDDLTTNGMKSSLKAEIPGSNPGRSILFSHQHQF